MKIKISSWASGFLIAYLASITLTPLPYTLSGLGARVILLLGVVTTLAFSLLRMLQLTKGITVSWHALVLQGSLVAVLMICSLPVFLETQITLDRVDVLRNLLVPVVTLLLAGYLAQKASDFGASTKLLKRTILVLSLASVVGISFAFAQATPLEIMQSLGLSPTRDEVERMLSIYDLRFLDLPRAQGFFAHPIEYGATLVLAYSVVRVRPDVVGQKYARWLVYFILVLGVLFSGSRSAWLGLVVAELMVRFISLKRPRKIFALIISVSVIFAFLSLNLDKASSYLVTVRSSEDLLDVSLAARLADYETVFDTITEHPFGVGYANWETYAESQGFGTENYVLDNDYLRFLAETGALGLLVYVLFVFRGFFVPVVSPEDDRSLAFVLTANYAWQAAAYDAFAFRIYTVVFAVLLISSLRLKAVNSGRDVAGRDIGSQYPVGRLRQASTARIGDRPFGTEA